MTDNDREALEMSMKILARDPHWGPALQERLDGRRYEKPMAGAEWILPPQPWEEVARFASGICQIRSLNLKPWEVTPDDPHVDPVGDDGSIRLRAKMDAAGISPWHPDPIAALREASS